MQARDETATGYDCEPRAFAPDAVLRLSSRQVFQPISNRFERFGRDSGKHFVSTARPTVAVSGTSAF